MRITIVLLVIILTTSCKEIAETKTTQPLPDPVQLDPIETVHTDTLKTKYPMGIGNDDGFVIISAIRTYENDTLRTSNFKINLTGFENYSLSKKVNKSVLINVDKEAFVKDTLAYQIDRAILKDIAYYSIRSNTLFFKATLEDPIAQKEINGDFSLFYTTKNKGELYGWFTREIKDIN